MFCSECGKEVNKEDKFCRECGALLDSTVAIVNNDDGNKISQDKESVIDNDISNNKNQKKKKGFFRTLFRIIRNIIIFVIAIFIILTIIFSFNDGQNSNTNSNQKTEANEVTKEIETEDEYIDSCKIYSYEGIEREPDDYIGLRAYFEGIVIQVQESGYGRVMRVEVESDDKVLYVKYRERKDNEERILEDDFIEIYGELEGVESYTAIFGNEITIPAINAKYIYINNPEKND